MARKSHAPRPAGNSRCVGSARPALIPPKDRDEALRVLRRAVELAAESTDNADSYGAFVSEHLIGEAPHPYDGVVVAIKGGLTRSGPGKWEQLARPEYLRQCVEMSLRHLGVERIELWQLQRIDKLSRRTAPPPRSSSPRTSTTG